MLLFQEFALADADAVFAGAGAAERQGARDDLLVQLPGAVQRRPGRRRDQDDGVEIAVADMADDAGRSGRRRAISSFAPRIASSRREIGTQTSVAMPRGRASARGGPVARRAAPATACCGSPASVAQAKPEAPKSLGDRLAPLRPVPARAASVPWNSRKSVGSGVQALQLGVGDAGGHLHLVQQFHARDGDADLHDGDDGFHRGGQRGELADRGGHRFGDAVQAELDLRDDAERAFGADEEAGEVVAGGGFARAPAGLDHAAIGQHDLRPSTFSRMVP